MAAPWWEQRGIPDLVADGDSGIVVPPDDLDALVDALVRADSEMGAHGPDHVASHLPRAHAAAVFERYSELSRT